MLLLHIRAFHYMVSHTFIDPWNSPLGRGFLTGQIKRPEDIPGNVFALRHLFDVLTDSFIRGRFPPEYASFSGGCEFSGVCLNIT